MIININAHFGHLLLLNVYELALLLPLQVPEDVYFLSRSHGLDVIYSDLRWSKWNVGKLWVESAKAQLLAYPSRGVNETLLLLSGGHCKLLLVYLHLIHLIWVRIENTWDLLATHIIGRGGLSCC